MLLSHGCYSLQQERSDISPPKLNCPARSVLWVLPAVMVSSIEHNIAVYMTIHYNVLQISKFSHKSPLVHILFTCYSGSWGSEFVYSTGHVILSPPTTWTLEQDTSSPTLAAQASTWKEQLKTFWTVLQDVWVSEGREWCWHTFSFRLFEHKVSFLKVCLFFMQAI